MMLDDNVFSGYAVPETTRRPNDPSRPFPSPPTTHSLSSPATDSSNSPANFFYSEPETKPKGVKRQYTAPRLHRQDSKKLKTRARAACRCTYALQRVCMWLCFVGCGAVLLFELWQQTVVDIKGYSMQRFSMSNKINFTLGSLQPHARVAPNAYENAATAPLWGPHGTSDVALCTPRAFKHSRLALLPHLALAALLVWRSWAGSCFFFAEWFANCVLCYTCQCTWARGCVRMRVCMRARVCAWS